MSLERVDSSSIACLMNTLRPTFRAKPSGTLLRIPRHVPRKVALTAFVICLMFCSKLLPQGGCVAGLYPTERTSAVYMAEVPDQQLRCAGEHVAAAPATQFSATASEGGAPRTRTEDRLSGNSRRAQLNMTSRLAEADTVQAGGGDLSADCDNQSQASQFQIF